MLRSSVITKDSEIRPPSWLVHMSFHQGKCNRHHRHPYPLHPQTTNQTPHTRTTTSETHPEPPTATSPTLETSRPRVHVTLSRERPIGDAFPINPSQTPITTMSLISRAKDLAYNPSHAQWLLPLLLVADAALCGLIIDKIPCSLLPAKPRVRISLTHPNSTISHKRSTNT